MEKRIAARHSLKVSSRHRDRGSRTKRQIAERKARRWLFTGRGEDKLAGRLMRFSFLSSLSHLLCLANTLPRAVILIRPRLKRHGSNLTRSTRRWSTVSMPRGQTSVYHRILIYIPPPFNIPLAWNQRDREHPCKERSERPLSSPPPHPSCVERAGTILCIQATMNKLRSEPTKVTLLFPLERREDSYQDRKKKKRKKKKGKHRTLRVGMRCFQILSDEIESLIARWQPGVEWFQDGSFRWKAFEEKCWDLCFVSE